MVPSQPLSAEGGAPTTRTSILRVTGGSMLCRPWCKICTDLGHLFQDAHGIRLRRHLHLYHGDSERKSSSQRAKDCPKTLKVPSKTSPSSISCLTPRLGTWMASLRWRHALNPRGPREMALVCCSVHLNSLDFSARVPWCCVDVDEPWPRVVMEHRRCENYLR